MKIIIAIWLSMLVLITTGCGDSSSNGVRIQDIPLYPGAESGESLQHSGPGGLMGGTIQQYSTADAYDDVVAFYEDALKAYPVETMSYASELGRQKAMSIPMDNGMVTVTIQEFTDEETVMITFMEVSL